MASADLEGYEVAEADNQVESVGNIKLETITTEIKNENLESGENEPSDNKENAIENSVEKTGDDSANTDKLDESGEKPKNQETENKADEDWEKNVLFVSGMPPGEAGSLKQLLNTTLGADCHRIRPRIRGDTDLYVLFRTEHDMKVAESLLHNQKFLKYKLTAKVVEGPLPQKRPAPRENRPELPPKKPKTDGPAHIFLDGSYDDQIDFKQDDVETKLHKVSKLLQGSYPKYGGLIFNRQLKHNGLICKLLEFKKCPPEECFATRCKFAIGLDDVTKEPAVGIRMPKREDEPPSDMAMVRNIASVNHNYPPHVLEAAKVFEKAVKASEKAPGKCNFWHELIVRTNLAQDLMLLVFVQCKQDSAADELKSLNEELKEFFENGEGKQCRVVSLYTKAVCTDVARPQQQSAIMELVMGSPYLEETVMGFKLHLLPMMYFWNSVHAAKMVCEGVEELLAPDKNISVLEIGCGIGLVGFHLSKLAGEVFSVDVDHLVEEAKKNAERNEITDVEHFAGKAEEIIPEMAKKLKFDKACAIVISSVNRFSTCPKAMEELRKIDKLKKIVLVTEMSTSRFSPIISLAKTNLEKGVSSPFFPVRAIPVDTMPHSRSYVLLVLLERISLSSLPKVNRKSMPSHGKRSYFNKKHERKAFFSRKGGGGGRSQWSRKQQYMQQSQFRGYPYDMGYGNEYQLQQMLAEERRRRMEVEQERRWLEAENRRRRMESRKKNSVQNLISDSLKEVGVPQLNSDTAQKLKEVIAEAIKSAGVLGQDAADNSPKWMNNQPPQSLLDLKLSQPPPPPAEPPYPPRNYGAAGPASGYNQPDMSKPYYAAGQDPGMYGRQGWNPRDNVQYPMGNTSASPYGQGKTNWQGTGPSYATYDTSNSQRGGFRNPPPPQQVKDRFSNDFL